MVPSQPVAWNFGLDDRKHKEENILLEGWVLYMELRTEKRKGEKQKKFHISEFKKGERGRQSMCYVKIHNTKKNSAA